MEKEESLWITGLGWPAATAYIAVGSALLIVTHSLSPPDPVPAIDRIGVQCWDAFCLSQSGGNCGVGCSSVLSCSVIPQLFLQS